MAGRVVSGASLDVFGKYLAAINSTFIQEKTEHTDRDSIKALLQHLAPSSITIVPEPRRVPGKGAPDFKVRQNGQIVGYLETKPIGTSLDELKIVLKSDQIARYRSLSQNIVLTDYLNWIWIRNGHIQSETLCDIEELQSRRLRLDHIRVERIRGLLSGFLSSPPQSIGRATDLADELAIRARLLRDFLGDELVRQGRANQGERLFGLYHAFKNQVSESITLQEFSDAFAQTLSYGLFLSKLNANGNTLHLHNAKQYIPKSFRLIEELVGFLDELENECYKDIEWVVDEVLSITNGLDVASIKEDLSFKNRGGRSRRLKAASEEEWRLFSRDPFIYFYENFLANYDAKLRKSRGVYYTPPPVVNFIVRGTDDILKGTFGLKDGLADDSRVTVLEFACGTGTFIVEIIQRIMATLESSPGALDLVLKEHALKNVFAFEYLIAPYTIAHLKLAQYLEDRQLKIGDDQRFNIFLTNTLEPVEPQQNFLLPALTEETRKASAIKNQPILVITGNPPYAGESKNKGEWIVRAINEYKFTMERSSSGLPALTPVREKNLKWLHDDYVKFIRFAQLKMDAVEDGIVAIITNHSYLDNPTFAGMRNSLIRTFNQIWIVDLHGSTKPKETPPNGLKNENVFDIKKGVAVAFLVKKAGAEDGVWRADVWGSRIEKYQFVSSAKLSELTWTKLAPQTPDYLFISQDRSLKSEFEGGFSVSDIFVQKSVGIVTARDKLAIHFDKKSLLDAVHAFVKMPGERARENFKLGKDVRDWKVGWAQKDLATNGPASDKATKILYRPFDVRWTYYTGVSRGFHCYPRHDVMRHLFRDNIALIMSRMTKGEQFAHVQATDKPAEVICMSPETSNNGFVFPLYLYAPPPGQRLSLPELFDRADPFAGKDRIENISPKFRGFIDGRYARKSPEKIFGYVYAVLHSRTYRNNYGEFLRREFPRIRFPEGELNFDSIANLGWDLAQKHLLRDVPSLGLAQYVGRGNHEVNRIEYAPSVQSIIINESQRFLPVPPGVWNFLVGGYKVIETYLKYRKGRKLTLGEINNITTVANALAFTIEQMDRIDEAYRATFS